MDSFKKARAWWMTDTALHTYVFCSFLVGIPLTIFNTYVLYQIQVVGFLIGADNDGLPCTTYCIVPWGNTRLDLNSVILYINALTYGLGGFFALILCAYSDYWPRKHLLVTISIICYGIFCIPAYWLQGYDARNFAALIALFVVFNTFMLILAAVLQIYIPHCMRVNGHTNKTSVDKDSIRPADLTTLVKEPDASVKRRYGFNMSVFGSVATASGAVVMLVVTIVLTQTLTGTAAQTAGLLITTTVGFLTVVGSIVAYLGFPQIPSKPHSEIQGSWTKPLILFFTPLRDLVARKNLAALLVAYTIYIDGSFAVASVTGQIFIAEIRPDALEFSLYALAQTLMQLVLPIVFLWLRPKISVRLEMWMIIGYSINLLVPMWGCIGLADVDFGFKRRWEFYAQIFVANLAGSIANCTFRVLFAELLPRGAEVQWFAMQVVLSCATIWVNYVASGPLQNTTHELRYPLVLCLVVLVAGLGLEVCRVALPVFTRDRLCWDEKDRDDGDTDVSETSVVAKHG